MTPSQVVLVRESFECASARVPAIGTEFYETLFRLNPSCRAMFPHALHKQASNLMQMLHGLIDALEQAGSVPKLLLDLGLQHAHHGVEESHYDDMGAALLQVLHAALSDQYSAEIEDAWASLYAELAETMICAAKSGRTDFPEN